MIKYFFLAAFCLSNLNALLPPLYESLHQFQAIINDPKFTEPFQSGEAILSIEQTGDGNFLIKTNHHTLEAKVESLQQSVPGPGHYKVHFGIVK